VKASFFTSEDQITDNAIISNGIVKVKSIPKEAEQQNADKSLPPSI
jgi:hypothetical protein